MNNKPTKKVRCRHCEHIFEVEAQATHITCPKCGKDFWVAFISLIGGKFL